MQNISLTVLIGQAKVLMVDLTVTLPDSFPPVLILYQAINKAEHQLEEGRRSVEERTE